MHITRNVVIVFAALLVIAVGIGGATAASALQAKPTALAVVDLQRTFENLKQQQQIRADLQTRQEQLRQQQEERRKQVSTLQADLDLLAEGSAAYQQKAAERDKAVIELQVWQEYEARKLRIDEQLMIEQLFREAQDTIERVAKDNGFDVVLFKNQVVNMQGGQNQQTLNIRIVAWNSETIDLTDQVIQRLNNEFQAGQ